MTNNEVINVFSNPFELWSYRDATYEERLEHMKKHHTPLLRVKHQFEGQIESAFDAAVHIIRKQEDNTLKSFIRSALNEDPAYHNLCHKMQTSIPPVLSAYQTSYPNYNRSAVEQAINQSGVLLPDGQYLFHGGCWPSKSDVLTTDRPLSTTFDPQVALANAAWWNKIYKANRFDLMVVRVTEPQTKAYFFGPDSEFSHELEIVFASGAHLKRMDMNQQAVTHIKASKSIDGQVVDQKMVPAYVIEVELC